MSDKRKLLGEMDRCFKKVQEGVDSFDDIWQKLHAASNSNQKDKFENDLKKEIKKLQRLRDQIKTWNSSNDVKDKKPLLENRKLIETRMERFKVVERETKTKAYSKEGLVSAAKVNPAQKVVDETMQWLQITIDSINQQVDRFEGEIECFNSQSRKKKSDRDKQTRIEELKVHLEKHRYHIKNLETLMRMLDNQTIKPDKINVIRDDIEYYLEACMEPGFEDNEFLYEDMGLDESLANNILTTTSPTEKQFNNSLTSGLKDEEAKGESVTSPTVAPNNAWNSKDEESRKRLKSDDFVSPRKPNNQTSNNQRTTASRSLSFPAPAVTTSTITQKQNSKPAPVYHNQPYAAAAAAGAAQPATRKSTPSVAQTEPAMEASQSKPPTSATANNTISWPVTNHITSVDTNTTEIRNTVDSIVSSVESLSVSANCDSVIISSSEPWKGDHKPESVVSPTLLTSSIISHTKIKSVDLSQMQNGPISHITSLKNGQEQSDVGSAIEEEKSSLYSHSTTESLNTLSTDKRSEITSFSQPQKTPAQQASSGGGEAHIAPLLGVAPLGSASLTKDQVYQQAMLEACWRHMPYPTDSERLRQYLQRNPYPTPSYYQQGPLLHQESVDYFLKLSTETLFFIFYYMEATKAQYMAAKALKKQSWRFHTKYMMWFQRHEEPKTITDEYEQGTYIYFDYQKWGQRKKEDFTFEYRYLEDRELQ